MKIKITVCTILLAILLAFAACNGQPELSPLDDYDYVAEYEGETEAEADNGETEDTQAETEAEPPMPDYTEAEAETPGNYAQLPGKIAIILHEWHSSQDSGFVAELTQRHGPENILIHTWPMHNHSISTGEAAAMINEIAENADIKVLIVNPAIQETDYFINTLRQLRDDIFIAHIGSETAAAANLILDINSAEMARRFPASAMALGADALVFFYDSVIWGDEVFVESYLQGMLREKSAEIGLLFVEVDIGGAIQCGSSYAMFMSETIPLLIERYGANIVLYGLDNERVFWHWRIDGFMYIPTLPSWFVLCPATLAHELAINDNARGYNTPGLIDEIRNELEEIDMLGRMAILPMSTRMLFPLAAAEYGVMWMHGDVPAEGIDTQVLTQIMVDLIAQYTGQYHSVALAPFEENGTVHENFMLVWMEFLTIK